MTRSLSWTMADVYSLEDLDTEHDFLKKAQKKCRMCWKDKDRSHC